MKRLLLVPYCFVLMNWAAMKALYWFLRKRELESVWVDPRRPVRRRRHNALGSAES